jgi:hypothetical protein
MCAQCAIPVFDGLLPEPHNTVVMRLLFTCAHWHGLAKLRMHTDITLNIMDDLTTTLGDVAREFQQTVCSALNAKSLPREVEAAGRRQAKKSAKSPTSAKDEPSKATQGNQEPRPRKGYSLNTYKFHSLGDYVETIRRYGTTDSYTTEVVSCIVHFHLSV